MQLLRSVCACACVATAWATTECEMPTGNSSDAHANVKSRYSYNACKLKESWDSLASPELPCALPALHGPVEKKATMAQSTTLHLTPEGTQQFVSEGLPIYGRCQIYVSIKFKFIFVRQAKSSSTAILNYITRHLCAGEECTADELLNTVHIDDDTWNSFFVFTFVRNPWARMASAFDMMTHHFLYTRQLDGSRGDHCALDFQQFSEDTNAMRQICDEYQCCPYLGNMHKFIPAFIDLHINDQSHCVFLANGDPLVDFVGRSELMDEDWPLVLENINQRAGTNFVFETVVNPNGQGSKDTGGVQHSCQSGSLLQMFDANTLYNIGKQYASDVVMYGYR